ncbi:MAG: cyclic nucleotide-binding domain-containing protein [Pseudomonadota bacterium]|nr:cyclic nucleotide-binding domain-containing protein [Pseudomonadota bacterium]
MNIDEHLLSIPLFSEMTNDELKILGQSMVVKDYPDKHQFISEEGSTNTFYVILEGEVGITHEKDTERGLQRVSIVGPGSMIGLHKLIGHHRPIVSCHAKGKVKAAFLPGSAFNLLYQFNTRLPHHFQMIIAKQLAADYRNIVVELKEMMLEDISDG